VYVRIELNLAIPWPFCQSHVHV